MFKDYNKKTYKLSKSWGKWVALSKKKGQTVDAGVKSADISVKGKTLIVKKGNMKIVCKK